MTAWPTRADSAANSPRHRIICFSRIPFVTQIRFRRYWEMLAGYKIYLYDRVS